MMQSNFTVTFDIKGSKVMFNQSRAEHSSHNLRKKGIQRVFNLSVANRQLKQRN